ncbi:MAG: hypothetical protein WKG32_13860 [Gemmatimonadaceae bacterium]
MALRVHFPRSTDDRPRPLGRRARVARALTSWFVATTAAASGAAAQRATIFYDHTPAGGDVSSRLSFRAPGSATRIDQRPPQPIEIDQGGQLYFVVEHANPLLYTYAVTTKALTVSPSRLNDMEREFAAARAALKTSLCADVGDHGMTAALSITAKAEPPKSTGVTLSRPTDGKDGKPVVAASIDPQSTALFELAPGAVVNLRIQDRREFRLENGVVRSSRGSPTFDQGAFFNVRLTRRSPVWASFGVLQADKGKGVPFFGLLARFGYSLSGAHATLGTGVTLLDVSTDITQGSVGQALPAGVATLDDIVRRERKPAYGITFTVSGFEFGKKQ